MNDAFANVYWIGGSPCSGKSTLANQLAATYGMAIYRCDEAYFTHLELITPERYPTYYRLAHASCDELWMRPITQQVDEELELYREEFSLITTDLAQLAADRPVIAEGAALLPDLLDQLGICPRRAVWIVPTETFQRTHYERRAWRHNTLTGCTEQEQAWENWMQRDAGFAKRVADEARRCGYRLLTTDGNKSISDTIAAVQAWFEL